MQQTELPDMKTEVALPPFALTFDVKLIRQSDRRVKAKMEQGRATRLLVVGDPYHLHLPSGGSAQRVQALLESCVPAGSEVRLVFRIAGDR